MKKLSSLLSSLPSLTETFLKNVEFLVTLFIPSGPFAVIMLPLDAMMTNRVGSNVVDNLFLLRRLTITVSPTVKDKLWNNDVYQRNIWNDSLQNDHFDELQIALMFQQ